MKKYLLTIGIAFVLGACSTPTKSSEESTTEVVMDSVETLVDTMAVEMDSVMTEVADSVSVE